MRGTFRSILTFGEYALVGAVASAAELTLLHSLTIHTSLWYVYASAISSLLSFFIGFILRKVWVFRDPTWKDVPRQASLYFLSLVLVVGSSTLLMSFFYVHFHFHYLLAQFSAGLITGLIGFIINRQVTFRPKKAWSFSGYAAELRKFPASLKRYFKL